MSVGTVYILVNNAFPDLVKIGRTARDVGIRAFELWGTGVPEPFWVYAQAKTNDCVFLERVLHRELQKFRHHKSREFFEVDPELAAEKLMFWAWVQASEAISELFGGGLAVTQHFEHVDGGAIERLSEELGCSKFLVSQAMADLSSDELKPAVDRILKRDQEELEALEGAHDD